MATLKLLISLFVFHQLGMYQVSSGDTADALVDVTQGRLMGRKLKTVNQGIVYYAFQGVPYAEPPMGDLRFMPPEPHKKWKGTFIATKAKVRCPQEDPLFDRFPSGEEDCLTLNVYSPWLPMYKNGSDPEFPVMFWIHGGGFAAGSSNPDLYGPDFFVSEEVVLVTVNYRLGALGFMNLEDDVISGNMGLKDIILALKWVQENIHAFNGDKNSVTIFGNNAGATAVSLLMHSPIASGLFNKAICQSGVFKLPQLFAPNPRQRAFNLAKVLHKNPDNSQELLTIFQRLNPLEFVKATPRTFDSTEVRDSQKSILPFGPSIENVTRKDGAFLTVSPDELSFNEMPNKKIPLMLGFNSEEAIVFLRTMINEPEILTKLNYNFQFSVPLRGLQFEYNSPDYKAVSSKIKEFYFDNSVIRNTSMKEYVNYVTDSIFYPIHKTLVEHMKITKAKTFYYKFSYDGSLNFFKNTVLRDKTAMTGATNGDEICYLFKCGKLGDLYEKMFKKPVQPDELTVSEMMVRMWTNFAKYGNPTPKDDVVLHKLMWRPVTPNNHYYLDIGRDFKLNTFPRSENVQFWDQIYNQYSSVKTTDKIVKTEL